MVVATSFGTACILRRATQAFAISHFQILHNNATFSFQRQLSSHFLSVSTSSALAVMFLAIWGYMYHHGDLLQWTFLDEYWKVVLDDRWYKQLSNRLVLGDEETQYNVGWFGEDCRVPTCCVGPMAVFPCAASGVSQAVQALKGEIDELLKGVGERSVTKEVKHILEMVLSGYSLARRASLKRETLHTDFLTPPVLKESMQVLEKIADVKAIAQGGYPQAERCRISVGHPEELTSDPDIISALSIKGNFQFEPCSHGDFLGSILGTGIVREKLGDIILQINRVHILTMDPK
ncbi:unnamed protein product [Sphenostylis stenocarpa]|uniref:Ribosome-associated protein quality control protein P2 RNA-binding domain-containing protein n=1 Tax=Sphenostylis stenocarpa TaxID=92480 RepID=A0AA86VID6_9FABA|nr:unnamed protein product [Sphenostylis stenocarpa]